MFKISKINSSCLKLPQIAKHALVTHLINAILRKELKKSIFFHFEELKNYSSEFGRLKEFDLIFQTYLNQKCLIETISCQQSK